jgi:hypothetical protein
MSKRQIRVRLEVMTMTRVTYVCEINEWHNEPVKEQESQHDVDLGPERNNQGITNQGNLTPVEGKNAHSQPKIRPEQSIDSPVLRTDPAYPRE